MTEDELKERVSRGQRADEILGDEIVKMALSHLHTTALSVMKKTRSGPKGDEDRQELHRLLLTTDRFESFFVRLVRDGRLAERELTKRKTLLRRVS